MSLRDGMDGAVGAGLLVAIALVMTILSSPREALGLLRDSLGKD